MLGMVFECSIELDWVAKMGNCVSLDVLSRPVLLFDVTCRVALLSFLVWRGTR